MVLSLVNIRLLRVFLFYLFYFLIDIFFDVDSKSTTGFRRSHIHMLFSSYEGLELLKKSFVLLTGKIVINI